MELKFLSLLGLMMELFFANGAVYSETQSALERHRRNDDTNPLTAVVDHLSQQMTALNAEVTALKSRTSTLETPVAFYTWHNAKPMTVVSGATLIMDHVITNVGGHYDPHSGIFTAPVSGFYDFQASLMPYLPTGKVAYASIYVNEQMVALGIADCSHGDWDQTSIRAIVHVTSGQRVTLRNPSGATAVYFSGITEPYTSFSGLLVKAD